MSAAVPGRGHGETATILDAVLTTLAYGDVFDYPLTAAEIHRDLVACRATPSSVVAALEDSLVPAGRVERHGSLYALEGRGSTVNTRARREAAAATLWPTARRRARAVAALPWVRMVGVTGSLAMTAVDAGADIDLMVVAAADHVWTCRALLTALARAAGRVGPSLCPNYVVSDRALALTDRSLYTAHELYQLVPLAGPETYLRLLRANAWARAFLPNRETAAGPPHAAAGVGGAWARILERVVAGRPGDALERGARRIQVARLSRKLRDGRLGRRESALGEDGFKGHFDGHGARILTAWERSARRAVGGA